MCTVSFIPLGEKICITSNRDEKQGRSRGLYPSIHKFTSGNIMFPQDAGPGGTWFAVHENGNALVFLNGGHKSHIPKPPYRKSRGLVLLDLIDQVDPIGHFQDLDLNSIEPFTAIFYSDGSLMEGIWDGQDRTLRAKNPERPHIWASVTLYDQKAERDRRTWFEKWLGVHPHPTQADILDFHRFSGDGDHHYNLLMNRNDLVFTVSITSVEISPGYANLQYVDVLEDPAVSHQISLSTVIPAK
jgi:hypothetical protein